MPSVQCAIVALALLATIASSIHVYPHELAYFNEMAGGPENGHKHLLHSNLDWGQDYLYLRSFIKTTERPLHLIVHPYVTANMLDWPNRHCKDENGVQTLIVSRSLLCGQFDDRYRLLSCEGVRTASGHVIHLPISSMELERCIGSTLLVFRKPEPGGPSFESGNAHLLSPSTHSIELETAR